MSILSTSDLVENKQYYATLSPKGRVRKIRILGVVNSYSKPEIFFQVLDGGIHFGAYSIFLFNEIGIGLTKEDATANYGKLVDGLTPSRYNSDDELKVHLQRVKIRPNKFEYFNYRNFIHH